QGSWLYTSRAPAGYGASVLRLVGLSGPGFLRADQPLRLAGGLQIFRRRMSPGRPGPHSRLGSRPFSEGRARSGAIRWNGAVRARGSTPGRASGLGHTDFQLLAQRSAELPAVECAVLAG